jgi:site-specific recombinase XerC
VCGNTNGKDGVAGSIPAGGSTQALTSGNAGQFRVSGRLDWPHNGNWPHPLTSYRLRYGPAMTADYAPSLLRSFERHLRAENRSDSTIESYLESIRQAEAFLAGRGRTLLDARRADLEAFLGDLLQRRAPATAATRYKVLRILYAWLEEEEEIDASPMVKMRPPIVPEQPVPIVPEDGLRRLLAACAGKHFEGRRDTAIVMFLLDTGARRAELVGLRLADLDLDLDVAIVVGKGRRERALPFGRKTAVALDRYLRVRARHATPSCPGCGSASVVGSARMASGRSFAAGVPRPAFPTYTRTSFATPSLTPGSPKGAVRRTSCGWPAGGPGRCSAATAPLPPTSALGRRTVGCRPVTACRSRRWSSTQLEPPELLPSARLPALV